MDALGFYELLQANLDLGWRSIVAVALIASPSKNLND